MATSETENKLADEAATDPLNEQTNEPESDAPTQSPSKTESKSNPSTITDEIEQKEVKSNDNQQQQEETKEEEKNNNNNDDANNIDFDAIDKILFAEEIGVNTSTLSWDDIKFETDEEKDGAMTLQTELKSKQKLTTLPPFEMARFYIGSKCRVPKASKKWLDTMAIYKTHNLQSITEQQMIKCFREMSRCMRFGGVDQHGKAIFAIKYSLWLPANYESTAVIMKCFLLILNYYTEDLQYSRDGMIFIADCADMGWVNFNLDMEKIFTKLMQDAYPLRVGAMYMLDAGFLLNVLLKICKPFLSKKMQERMFIMSTEEMFKTVPKEQVPDIINGGCYDDNTHKPVYETCIRYMRRGDIDHFAPCNDQ